VFFAFFLQLYLSSLFSLLKFSFLFLSPFLFASVFFLSLIYFLSFVIHTIQGACPQMNKRQCVEETGNSHVPGTLTGRSHRAVVISAELRFISSFTKMKIFKAGDMLAQHYKLLTGAAVVCIMPLYSAAPGVSRSSVLRIVTCPHAELRMRYYWSLQFACLVSLVRSQCLFVAVEIISITSF
jgi:hypothetical protein